MRFKTNLNAAAREIGKSKDYFCVMKRSNSVRYRFMRLYGKGNLVAGYYKWLDYFSKKQQKLEEIYFEFKTNKDFADWIIEKNIYKKRGGAFSFVEKIFLQLDNIDKRRVASTRKIIKEWRKEKC